MIASPAYHHEHRNSPDHAWGVRCSGPSYSPARVTLVRDQVGAVSRPYGVPPPLTGRGRLTARPADLTTPARGWKERVRAAASAFGFEWSRTRGFYFKTARRVEAGEMDAARREIERLRFAAEQRANAEHVEWLGRTLAYLETTDPELYRPAAAALEHAFGDLGARRGAVAVSNIEGEVK